MAASKKTKIGPQAPAPVTTEPQVVPPARLPGTGEYFLQHAGKPAPNKVANAATVKNVKGPAPGPAVYANQQEQKT